MPHIRIESPTGGPGKIISANPTRVFMDGVELNDVREVLVRYTTNAVVTAEIVFMATDNLSLDCDMRVEVCIVVPAGMVLVESNVDGKRAYRAMRDLS